MGDNFSTITVVLDNEKSGQDLEVIKEAIKMIKGVHSVENGHMVDLEDYTARVELSRKFAGTLHKVISSMETGREAWKDVETAVSKHFT